MRKAHFLKSFSSTKVPTSLLFFDCETKGIRDEEDSSCNWQELWFGVAYYCRLEQGKKTRIDSIIFTKPHQFWNFLKSKLSRQRPLWVFAHNLLFDFTVVNGWYECSLEGWEWKKKIIECPPFYLQGFFNDQKIHFCDTLNYFRVSLEVLGYSIDLPKFEMPKSSDSYSAWKDYCIRDVEVIVEAITRLISFVIDKKLGPWKPTMAGQSMSAYCHRFMKHDILIHDNTSILKLERKAYHGGLVLANYIGQVPAKKIYQLDVNSLYPSCMLQQYPTKLVSYSRNLDINDLKKLANNYGLVATVWLNTTKNTYPIKHNQRLYYPRGRYKCTLCGIELLKALSRKEITGVEKAAWYDLSNIFSDYVDYFYTQRRRFKSESNDAFQEFCKRFMNSLYGKFVQTSPRWHPWNEYTFRQLEIKHRLKRGSLDQYIVNPPDFAYGEEEQIVPELEDSFTCRRVFGDYEIRLESGESYNSSPAIGAFVTAYARNTLQSLMNKVGEHNYYYGDTDSLFVNTDGFNILKRANEIHQDMLGKLKLEGEFTSLCIYGPKDYLTNEDHVVKGIRKNAIQISDNEYLQDQFEGVSSVLHRGCQPKIGIKWIIKTLYRKVERMEVLPSGWTRPIIFRGQEED